MLADSLLFVVFIIDGIVFNIKLAHVFKTFPACFPLKYLNMYCSQSFVFMLVKRVC